MASTSLGGLDPGLSTMRLIAAKCWPVLIEGCTTTDLPRRRHTYLAPLTIFAMLEVASKQVRLTCPQGLSCNCRSRFAMLKS